MYVKNDIPVISKAYIFIMSHLIIYCLRTRAIRVS